MERKPRLSRAYHPPIGSTLALCTVMMLTAGCSKAMIRQSTATVVDATLDEIAREPNRLRPQLQTEIEFAARALASELVRASVDALTEDQRHQQIHHLTEEFTDLVITATEGAAEAVGPSLRGEFVATVDAGLEQVLSDQRQRDTQEFGQRVAETAARSFTRELQRSIGDDIAPATTRAIEAELGPALSNTLTAQVKPALTSTARDMTSAALVEVNHSMRTDMRESMDMLLVEPMRASMRASMRESEDTVARWLVLLVLTFTLLGVTMSLFAVWYLQQWAQATAREVNEILRRSERTPPTPANRRASESSA